MTGVSGAAGGTPVTRRGVVALGSNLGERDELLRDAVAALAATPGVTVTAASSPVSSVAVTLAGPDESKPTYLNAVALVETTLEPLALLDALQAIEHDHGRVRDERWGDRTLDLDVVVLGDLECDTERLTLPHPRAHERAFVLEPWLQVDEEARLGSRGRVADLLAALPDRTRPVPGATSLLDPSRASSATGTAARTGTGTAADPAGGAS
ncbi:2-amino-4-hydroxy-6-hydroxymethyldihydropteridine diphosphokinase [Frigoribacterium sp. PvP032]|uniref:2-amino-4-hydroxy-6- hydroxymethyldihydropteridine diphosphokinase n=1 Tax=Frigoribacterium sp. PvP032 TaxID=2806589 RepID=UPI001B56B17E|nr:2-amino-4-hydroxy-6-hydroxymethyldihydropteridine diphosphokinase [Frigoribacterium sp. PvP032]MBP1189095.1 2-amino-4-hydroxy-6-hydroxymethyldihydropteridine diphosphokinase/dihydroneopterin aldolase/2-amino-4-hydroxy-6-hydroxymethyldihydropteridine diphosphokinase [Frigoribacterium sp. PvP032]